MPYTPPSQTAVDFTFQGAAAFTPPPQSAVSFSFASSGSTFAVAATATCSFVGVGVGFGPGTGNVAADPVVAGVGAAIAHSVFAAGGEATAAGAIGYGADGAGSSAATATANVLGGGVLAGQGSSDGSTTTDSTGQVIGAGDGSATVAASAAADGQVDAFAEAATTTTATAAATGAWTGASGGDMAAVISSAAAASAVWLSAAQASGSAATSAAAVGGAVLEGDGYGAAEATGDGQAAWFVPAEGNGRMYWYAHPIAEAVGATVGGVVVVSAVGQCDIDYKNLCVVAAISGTTRVVAGAAASAANSMAAGAASLVGDATFTVVCGSSAVATQYADMVGVVVVRPSARAYSTDGTPWKFSAAAVASVTGVGGYSVAAHVIEAYFETDAIAALHGTAAQINASAYASAGAAQAYSFRGLDYDEASAGAMRAVTLPVEARVYIGE